MNQFLNVTYLLCDLCSNRLEYGYESNVMWVLIDLRVEPINNNNNNNLIFILRKIHVNTMKCALHESKLSTLISYPK